MFGLGIWELVVILLVALLVLGPAKLPQVARQLGKGLRELRRAMNEVQSSFDDAVNNDDQPRKLAAPVLPPEHAVPAQKWNRQTAQDDASAGEPASTEASETAADHAAATADAPAPGDGAAEPASQTAASTGKPEAAAAGPAADIDAPDPDTSANA